MVSKKAKIGKNVLIGDYTTIKDDVIVADNVIVDNCVLIDDGSRISEGVHIHHGAIIASPPQDLKYANEETFSFIGKNTVIREFATVARGTKATGKSVVGENCLLMNYSHIAHDSILGNNVIMANYSGVAGHVTLGDWVIIGGSTGIHQFCKIGKHVMLGAGCLLTKDIPPFVLAGGSVPKYRGLNNIGLSRRGFSKERIGIIKKAYEYLYRSNLNISDGVKKIKDELEINEDINEIITFIEESTRGIIPI